MADSNLEDSSRYLPKGQGYTPPSRPPAVPPYPGNRPGAPDPYYQPAAQYPPPGAYAVMPQKPYSTKAIVSMVLGGAGIFLCPLGALTGPIGVILGLLGMKESRAEGGTHRGRGLAIGGLLVSIFSFLISAAVVAAIVFFVIFAVEMEEKQRQRRETRSEEQRAEERADTDLRKIEDKLWLYFIENNRSLDGGGPVVRGQGEGLLPEGLPKVEGELRLSDLLEEDELENPLSDYQLEVVTSTYAKVTCKSARRQMTVDYSKGFRSPEFRDTIDYSDFK